VGISKSKSSKLGNAVNLRFILTQNKPPPRRRRTAPGGCCAGDHFLLNKLVNYFSCGNIKEDRKNNVTYFYVSDFDNIIRKILPFF
jgi:hypothetical protein